MKMVSVLNEHYFDIVQRIRSVYNDYIAIKENNNVPKTKMVSVLNEHYFDIVQRIRSVYNDNNNVHCTRQ